MSIKESQQILKDNLEEINSLYPHKDYLKRVQSNSSKITPIGINDLINPKLIRDPRYIPLVIYIDKDSEYLPHLLNVSKEYHPVIYFYNLSLKEIKNIILKYSHLLNSNFTYTIKNCRYNLEDYHLLTKEELLRLIEKIKEICTYINHFNLSPYEKIIFLYDLIKEKPYHEQKDLSKDYQNNSIYEVLFNKYITCLGYSNIFELVLKELGYEVNEYSLSSNTTINNIKVGHSLNTAKVIDPKYKINGTYIFDITKDNSRHNDINSYDALGEGAIFLKNLTRTFNIENNSTYQELLKTLSEYGLNRVIQTQAIYNVRKITHSLDIDKYYELTPDMSHDAFLSLSKEDTSKLQTLYFLRKLLHELTKETLDTFTIAYLYEEIKDILDVNLITTISKNINIIKNNPPKKKTKIIDYTINPITKDTNNCL